MKIIYAKEDLPKLNLRQHKEAQWVNNSIFLAGPTPRSQEVPSWRQEALRLLEEKGFKGTVFVPEDRDGVFKGSYIDQVEWEQEALYFSGCVLFWIPRDLETMPGFTTNVEFGLMCAGHRVRSCVLGAPPDAPKMKYLRYLAEKENIASCFSLPETIDAALNNLGLVAFDLSRFSLGTDFQDYHSNTQKAIQTFLGKHLGTYSDLQKLAPFLEGLYGAEVPLSLEVDVDPEGWEQQLTIHVNLKGQVEETVEAGFDVNDNFFAALLDWEDTNERRCRDIHIHLQTW